MKVPFTLHQTAHPGPVTAVLLLSEKTAELLELCARISAEAPAIAREWPALPPIHAVPDGFLVKLGRPVAAVFPGTIRLRSRVPNLFLPADAELAPSLLDEEAAGLVRERGLIFLPGGRVLAFAPDQLVTADMLLSLPRLPQREWYALPPRPQRPERLEAILLDMPDETPSLILESGGEGIGEEAPRPADAGPIARTAGKAALGAGQGLAWLGKMLHLPGLAKLGAMLASGALGAVPRLSELLLGQQEAALRELLRKFRDGNLEDALRHALPLSNSPGRGSQPASGASLPTHALRYRLTDLLHGARGPSSIWVAPLDIHAELRREYQKTAEDATARGDYRRAAFIYGRLLDDYRRAADVLTRGGLHHDAAILYLEILGDHLAAARAFEAAGETDRALRLYQQRGAYLLAGDLLRRLGEEEAAVSYYVRAADQLAAAENYVAAADLMFSRAERPDLGQRYLAEGWARRPRGCAIPCLLRLTQWHSEQDEQRQLLALVAEAEQLFAPPGNEHGASQFFNALAQTADRPNLAPLREELRDRALRALAGKLRHRAETELHPGAVVSDLFGASGAWKAAVVSDADFAFRAALKKKDKLTKQTILATAPRLRLGAGQVTAVCAARISGRVFLGFNNGSIRCFHPHTESHIRVATPRLGVPIIALATDDHGNRLIALLQKQGESSLFSFAISETGYDLVSDPTFSSYGPGWLTPIAEREGARFVGFWNGKVLDILSDDDLLPVQSDIVRISEDVARAGLVLNHYPSRFGTGFPVPVCLVFGDIMHFPFSSLNTAGTRLQLGWRPCSQLRGLCSPPPLSWMWSDARTLDLAGVHEDDSIHWTQLFFSDPKNPALCGGASTPQGKYRAAVLVRPGLIAGVHDGGVDWLSRQQHRLLPRSTTRTALEDAIACAASLPTGELLVICRDGSVVRLPLPS